MNIRVIRIDLRPDDGKPLRAFVDVQLTDGTTLRALRVVEMSGKWPQVLCPQISIKPPGRPAYFKTVITLPDALKSAVDFAVIGAWREAVAGRKGKDDARLGQTLPQAS